MRHISTFFGLSLFVVSGLLSANPVSEPSGIYVAGQIGIFSAFGGYRDSNYLLGQRESAPLSVAAPTVSISAGYDFSECMGFGLRLQGAYIVDGARSVNDLGSPNDFGITMLDANFTLAYPLLERLKLQGAVFGGPALISPTLLQNGTLLHWNVGGEIGILFDTLLSGMTVGLQVAGHAFFLTDRPADASAVFWGASILPSFKYTF